MRSTAEIVQSIDNIGKSMAAMSKTARLMKPLMDKLLPVRYELRKAGAPQSEMHVSLSKSEYKEQFDEGIDLCVGLTINWID